jgi:hypothetical protein
MRRSFCFVVFLVGSLAVFACKEDEKRPPATTDTGQATSSGVGGGGGGSSGEGGVLDSGDSDSGGDAGSCNALDNDGNVVDQNRIVGDPPTGTGGQIADGTWELTEAALYVGAGGTPGPSGVTFKGVLRLTLGKLERVTEMTANQGANPITTRTFGDLVAGGSSFTVTQSCPAPFQDQYTYSVVNNTLNITSLITKESFTFTLR